MKRFNLSSTFNPGKSSRVTTSSNVHNASHPLFASGGDKIEFFQTLLACRPVKSPRPEQKATETGEPFE